MITGHTYLATEYAHLTGRIRPEAVFRAHRFETAQLPTQGRARVLEKV